MSRRWVGVWLAFLLLVGCPTSDPASVEAPETPDSGTAQGSEDVGIQCAVHEDCTGVFPELLACQISVCSLAGQCFVDVLPTGTECADGLVCTGPDFCLNGHCGGGPLDCNDFEPCTKDSCDGKTGCVFLPISGTECDDGNACTIIDQCMEGVCTGGEVPPGCCLHDGDCIDDTGCTDDNCIGNGCVYAFNYAPCNDDNPCTLKDHCDGGGGCEGESLICDDGNPCTVDTCNADTGVCEVSQAPDGTFCEDKNPCTNPDACMDGMCVGQGSLCQCTADLDCVPYEDTDLCNGTLKCLDFVCVVDPITVVACNPTGDTACVKNVCDPQTAQCVPYASPHGTECDDQNLCTDLDVCANGLCAGSPLICDDANGCTFDLCVPTSGCVFPAHNQPCNDGDLCTGNDLCGQGSCQGVTLPCDDGNICTDESCSPSSGCVPSPNSALCDDGNPCTTGDVCSAGSCTPGVNACQCTTDADCAAEEDDNQCNGTLHCDANQCTVDPATLVACNTTGDTTCSQTVCLPASGACIQQASPNGTFCTDLTACTTADACQTGVCLGQGVSCDDSNLCTDDVCDPGTGCANTPNGLLCNDDNLCTGNDQCKVGTCSGVNIACDDGNPCTVDLCEAGAGCVATPTADGTPCADGSVCTVFDACASGVCVGAPLDCDDANSCTADTCTNPKGCVQTNLAKGTPCDDGSACSNVDQCIEGLCVGNPPSCDDGDPCTVDDCDQAVGCSYTLAADGTACADGDPCTAPDACDQGDCVPGSPICGCQSSLDCAVEEGGNLCNGTLVCTPNGTCKIDPDTVINCGGGQGACQLSTCNPTTGACEVTAKADGTPCDDADGCTVNDTCQAGGCTGFPKDCEDGNPCTADPCAGGQCQQNAAFDGTLCADDNNSCTIDVCQAGNCAHLPLANQAPCADDGNPCTEDLCDKGECSHPVLSDALPCTDDGNQCTFDQCGGGVCQHVSNDPPPVNSNDCFPVQAIEADTGIVTGSWSDCGVADQFNFKCQGPNCTPTGAIDAWPCADPSFVYDGASTGYEYTYVFVAPADGVCTFIEHGEGIKVAGGGKQLFGVLDWFLLSGGACSASNCIEYVWENVQGDIVCGGGKKTCSYKEFAVTEGQVFYLVGDIFDGVNTHQGYDFNPGWSIEVTCDTGSSLLINEDFTDAMCTGCATQVNAGPTCADFGWHAVGGFADVVTGYYLGQQSGNTLVGYDCGETSAQLTFPTVALPANATSCTLEFDYYADLDAADDGNCTNDVLAVMIQTGGGQPQPVPGDPCAAGTQSSNPIGTSATPTSQTMSYDLTSYAGSNVTVSLEWYADPANNAGLGVIIDNVTLLCQTP